MDIIISISRISYNCRTKDLLELQLVVIFINSSSAGSQLIDLHLNVRLQLIHHNFLSTKFFVRPAVLIPKIFNLHLHSESKWSLWSG